MGCSLIGIVRGYSIQSYIPFYAFFLGGYILTSFSSARMLFVLRNERQKKSQTPFLASLLASFYMMLICLTGIVKGHHEQQADELYEQKNYSAALAMYQKEIDTWYLRASYNCYENMSLFGIAQCQCQLGNFEQARDTYQRLVKMARGYYRERGRKELVKLDEELNAIAAYEAQLPTTPDDPQKANILFDIAIAYRRIACYQKARDHYAMIQTLDIAENRKTQAREFAAEL